MLGRFLLLSLALLIAACSTAPVAYSPKDRPGDEPSGRVRPLRDLIGTSPALRLVFMHGVGDHCPGYALDPDDGWLDTKAMKAMGLSYVSSADEKLHLVNVSVFTGGERDKVSHVAYVKRQYRLKLGGAASDVSVEAIEITWSPLTQWIKSNQLGYDSPSTTPVDASDAKDCVPPADDSHFAGKPPPPRLWLDRLIKEQVFDRNLADAILYSGTYGYVMERGVSEALCRAVTSWSSESSCEWPLSDLKDDDTRYIFVTHSLGSRMLYDTFLDLLGRTTDAKKNPFLADEQHQATPAVRHILARTAGLYMMANQISLLGLASVPSTARSSQGMVPYVAYLDLKTPENSVLPSSAAEQAAPMLELPFTLPRTPPASKNSAPSSGQNVAPRTFAPSTAKFGDVLASIVQERGAAQAVTSIRTSLEIVAFSDTNDLLTWHLPPWYAVNESPAAGRTEVNFVNVFVQNTWKLLVIEDPTAAHGNYFKRLAVWEVIACGAESGHVRPCSP